MHQHLGPTVAGHRLLEGVEHKIGALGVVHAVADDKARVVVDQDQGEGRGAANPPLHEIEMPQVVGAHRFESFRVLSLDNLWRAIAGVFHDASHRVGGDLDPLASKLIADL